MPKIINSYAGDSPLADALKGFAGSFGANTPGMELARQKAYGTSRDNKSYEVLQNAERNNPNGYDPNDPNVRAAIVGLDKPQEYSQAQRFISATRYGAADPRATNTYMGAGGSYGSTVAGEREGQANKVAVENLRTQRLFDAERYKTDNTPELVQTAEGPRIMRRTQAFGQAPVLNEGQAKGTILQQDTPTLTPDQRAAAGGYTPKNPANIWVGKDANGNVVPTADGRTSLQNGAAIVGPVMKLEGAGTEGLSGNHQIDQKLLEARNAKDIAVNSIERLQTVLSKPNADQSMGYLGAVARGFNDLRAQADATARLFGGQLRDQAFTSPENKATVDNVMATIFTPDRMALAQARGIDANIIRSQVQDIAFMIAHTQNPDGRVGKDDIHRAAETVGGMIMDPKTAVPVLDDLKNRIITAHDIRERNTRQMYPGVKPAPGAPAAAAPTATPTAPSAAAPSIRIDVNGNIIP